MPTSLSDAVRAIAVFFIAETLSCYRAWFGLSTAVPLSARSTRQIYQETHTYDLASVQRTLVQTKHHSSTLTNSFPKSTEELTTEQHILSTRCYSHEQTIAAINENVATVCQVRFTNAHTTKSLRDFCWLSLPFWLTAQHAHVIEWRIVVISVTVSFQPAPSHCISADRTEIPSFNWYTWLLETPWSVASIPISKWRNWAMVNFWGKRKNTRIRTHLKHILNVITPKVQQ